jgi:hypothetical protein
MENRQRFAGKAAIMKKQLRRPAYQEHLVFGRCSSGPLTATDNSANI